MRKIFILLAMLITAFAVQAQNNETYLRKAFELLLEGNVKSAENHYTVYKKLSGKTDADFETMLQTEKANKENAWMDECYIIDIDNEYVLAVQKSSFLEAKRYIHSDASRLAKSSRLGSFTDWRLPTLDEISIVFANLPSGTIKYFNDNNADYYWTSVIQEGAFVYVSRFGSKSTTIYTSCKNNYIIVRKFKKNN